MLRRLSLLLALEGVALLAIGAGYAGYSLSRSGDHSAATLAGITGALTGVLLLLLARAAARRRGWARSPAVVLNLLAFPLALQALGAGAWWVGWPMIAVAGSVLYLFATPALRDAFRS